MKSKRSKATDITLKVRKEVIERDKYCVICGKPGNDIAHYINRSHGGLGIKENLVLLCRECHFAFDNGKSKEIAENIRLDIKTYLHFKYPLMKEENLKYKKWKELK